uniref:Uncharacterized protein n=1 Tax=Candidatus Kentrum sp. LFY TaxID=2126342 RepID=A0A450UGA0_9GAMM|nr:MAG: hypothetical protein BECKLFY1418B_GA0070995_102620 [Candidatus Kentron sp. LFY]
MADGFRFYERQAEGLGDYFLDSLWSDIHSLRLYGGIHAIHPPWLSWHALQEVSLRRLRSNRRRRSACSGRFGLPPEPGPDIGKAGMISKRQVGLPAPVEISPRSDGFVSILDPLEGDSDRELWLNASLDQCCSMGRRKWWHISVSRHGEKLYFSPCRAARPRWRGSPEWRSSLHSPTRGCCPSAAMEFLRERDVDSKITEQERIRVVDGQDLSVPE